MSYTLDRLLQVRGIPHILVSLVLAGLVSCSTEPEKADAPSIPVTVTATEWSLLEMHYEEAKAISPQCAEVGSIFRVAAENVEVLKTDKNGKPSKVRATGHVFLDTTLPERASGLCQEAIITSQEARLIGSPIMMYRGEVAKATSESTSFWVTNRLQVNGPFKMITREDLMQSLMSSNPLFPVSEPVELLPTTAAIQ
ncbi:hypothetical protein EI77_01022 [Prosthecobacter fusiformis]|uniref:Uncharacterized protein n=1 Tax=Prosthecobacter fusiformis TaxID=48464 RepID=A0A4R7SR15_9BACT|nr:hypothetical protein [Prosthecobacter fusiformis]TDU81712.1 hypothetical protein EI77_01022 [Prosthecobacter fusiformis]